METVDIIQDIVESIQTLLTVKTITDNMDGTYTITTDDTMWLQEGFPIEINSNDYTITNIVKDVSFTVSGTVLPVASTIDIYAAHYFHGTVINVKKEISTSNNRDDVYSRTPFVYLKEILEDDNYSKYSDGIIDKESDLIILFLTQCKMADWNTVDHYANSIIPMRKLVDSFINACYKSSYVGKFETFKTINHVNFGVYTTDKGNTKSIFNDQLSGVELQIKLPFLKQNCIN